jgi:hypothetical protein
VDPQLTETLCNPVKELHKVLTPFKAQAFKDALHKYGILDQFPKLILQLCNGFSIFHQTPPLLSTFTPLNHPLALEHADFVNNYFVGEACLGQISGPFSEDQVCQIFAPLGGHFCSAPISAVPKPCKPGQTGDQWCMVVGLSAKDTFSTSVNDLIDADDFCM